MKQDNNMDKQKNILDKIEKHPIIAVVMCIVIPIFSLQLLYWGLTFF